MSEEKTSSDRLLSIVSSNLRKLRIRNGWSQEEFAHRCCYHRTYISSIERGERNITLKTLEVFSKVLKVPAYELIMKNHPDE